MVKFASLCCVLAKGKGTQIGACSITNLLQKEVGYNFFGWNDVDGFF